MIPDPRDQPFMRVRDVAAALGISESSAYEAIHAGQIPAIRLGRRLRVPTAGVWRLADLTPDTDEAGPARPATVTTDTAIGGPHHDCTTHPA